MPTATLQSEAKDVLKQVFGFEEYRPLQKDIIHNVLEKKDTLAIMPTGGGKSLCYQLPALIFEGMTIVVSPLISLMKDQVDQLRAYNIKASYLNSSLSPEAYSATLRDVQNGELDLLYMAPETLLKSSVMNQLTQQHVSCFTIDEAHCISEWGHDFRPEYRQLATVRNRFPDAVTLALTATATPQVQDDIARNLEMDSANTFIASFDRKNLFLNVKHKHNALLQTVNFLKRHPEQSGIIYCFSRRQVDELTEDLNNNGFSALPYHAGLGEEVRMANQDAFIRDEVNIIVATIAFGMGIDKPDVRFVCHYDMPKNLEAYYQQIGRAGRDGLISECLFLFSYGDVGKIRYFINQKDGEEYEVASQHLEELLSYVESNQCRRIKLLDYFGETYTEEECEMCDHCTGEMPEEEDITVAAQKFMSTMVRTGQNYGFHHIADILLGSRKKKILNTGHDELSTYDIGNEYSRKQWKQVYRELVRQKIIFKSNEHGALKLLEKSVAVLKGESKVHGTIHEELGRNPEIRKKSDIESLDYDRELFTRLKEVRTQLARKEEVPPYIIFADATLMEMAYYRPLSAESLMFIHGVGTAKNSKYGSAFLEAIEKWCRDNNLKERESIQHKPSALKSGGTVIKKAKRRKFHIMGEAWKQGLSVEEMARKFEVKPITVLSNLKKYVEDGFDLEADRFRNLSDLDEHEFERAVNAFVDHGPEFLNPVHKQLNEEVSFDELRLVQLWYLSTYNH